MKITVYRKAHFNAAHRLHEPSLTDQDMRQFLESVTILITTATTTN